MKQYTTIQCLVAIMNRDSLVHIAKCMLSLILDGVRTVVGAGTWIVALLSILALPIWFAYMYAGAR